MAVLEGKTFRVEKPSCAPLRANAALAESVGIDHMRDKELEGQTCMRTQLPVEKMNAYTHQKILQKQSEDWSVDHHRFDNQPPEK